MRVILEARRGNSPLPSVNVDIHARGPDTGISFCLPIDASSSRLPDGSGHSNGVHEDSTKHLEGETDVNGQLIFGVSSTNEGETVIEGWLDSSDDDSFSAPEPTASLSVFWGSSPPQRVATSLSISHRGGFFGGRVGSQSEDCIEGRVVKVRKKKQGIDRVVGSSTSNSRGAWVVRAPRGDGKFYATVAGATIEGGEVTLRCGRARARTIGV